MVLKSIIPPGTISRGVFIIANRKSDKLFVGQLHEQFIIDLDGNM